VKPPNYKRLQNELLVQTFNIGDFSRCKEALKESNTHFYTYNLKNMRPVKYCLKYVPKDITIEEIERDLNSQRIPFMSISRIYNNKTLPKTPTQVLLITISGEDAKKLQSLKHLCHLSVKIEAYNTKNLPQCHNCQRFGHSSANCYLQPVCVKCGAKHASSQCKIKLDINNPSATESKIKCCNCGGNHPASYRGCPAYIKAKSLKDSKKTITNPQQPTQAPAVNKSSFPVLAPPPKVNAWTKKPTMTNLAPAPTAPPKSKTTPASEESTSFDFKSIFNQVKDLISEYIDLKKLWAAILKIIIRLKTEAKSSDDILTIIIEEASSTFLTIFK
jgi:hypothetical protein